MNGIKFVGELQFIFYNHILYENYTDAESQPNSLAVISVLIQLIENQENQDAKHNLISNEELSKLLETMDQIKYKSKEFFEEKKLSLLFSYLQFFLL